MENSASIRKGMLPSGTTVSARRPTKAILAATLVVEVTTGTGIVPFA